MPTEPPTFRLLGERARDCLGITLVALVLLVVLRPLQDAPFIDDWTYAWSVQWLLTHGELKILEWSAHLNVAQVLWGALFCLPFGFSFTALRASTWVLAVSCLWALYLQLRELGVPRRASLVGVATLGLNPIFFLLAHTFMTDIPCLTAMTWFTWAGMRALRQQDARYLGAAAVIASAAIATRAVALALPVAMAATLTIHAGTWGRKPRHLVIALLPVAFAGLLAWWGHGAMQHFANLEFAYNAPVNRLRYLREFAIPWLPQMLLFTFTFLGPCLGVALLPLSASTMTRALRRPVVAIWVMLIFIELVAWLFGRNYLPLLSPSLTWALNELGALEPLVLNARPPSGPVWCSPTAVFVALGSFAIFLARMVRQRRNGTQALLLWVGLGHFVVMAVLWLQWDRYAIVMFPVAIVLFVTATEHLRLRVALGTLLLLGAMSAVGLRDHLALNGALWRAVDELHARGVDSRDIDGGYLINGWLHYAHPEHAPRDAAGNPVIYGMTSAETGRLPYLVSAAPVDGWAVVTTVSYHRWLAPSGVIWVLHRPPGGTARGGAADERSRYARR